MDRVGEAFGQIVLDDPSLLGRLLVEYFGISKKPVEMDFANLEAVFERKALECVWIDTLQLLGRLCRPEDGSIDPILLLDAFVVFGDHLEFALGKGGQFEMPMHVAVADLRPVMAVWHQIYVEDSVLREHSKGLAQHRARVLEVI